MKTLFEEHMAFMEEPQERKDQKDYIITSLHTVHGLPVRVTVRRNTYDFQSSARVEFLTAVGWKLLDELLVPYVNEIPFESTVPNLRKAAAIDREKLIRIGGRLLAHMLTRSG